MSDLARRYEMNGGNIKNALLCAATMAALRPNKKDRLVSMKDLSTACDSEVAKRDGKSSTLASSMSMYS